MILQSVLQIGVMEKISKKKIYKHWHSVAPGVWGMKDIFVNVYMIHNPEENHWVLVDAGLKSTAKKIREMAEYLFWPENRPSAIILTHGHFDHVGSLATLAEEWDVPVYAHKMERPYLTGKSSYPPPDPTVGGGMMATASFLYPTGPINISNRLQDLPDDGSVPGLPEWRFIHTPGHAPGHISLFRKSDKVLVAGDAFVTTKAESAMCALTGSEHLSGPPKYFTYNWTSAADSVRKLAALEPNVIATGHGKPMEGEQMRQSLHNLADHFEQKAVPSHGRYVGDPAYVSSNGVEDLPDAVFPFRLLIKVALFTAAAVAAITLIRQNKREKEFLSYRWN